MSRGQRPYLSYQVFRGRGSHSCCLAGIAVGKAIGDRRGRGKLEINHIFDRCGFHAWERVAGAACFP
jgi:hypothetical protein